MFKFSTLKIFSIMYTNIEKNRASRVFYNQLSEYIFKSAEHSVLMKTSEYHREIFFAVSELSTNSSILTRIRRDAWNKCVEIQDTIPDQFTITLDTTIAPESANDYIDPLRVVQLQAILDDRPNERRQKRLEYVQRFIKGPNVILRTLFDVRNQLQSVSI